MARCGLIKPNGGRCKGTATGQNGLCWAHVPGERRPAPSWANRYESLSSLFGVSESAAGPRARETAVMRR